MATLSQTTQQFSPNKQRDERGRPRHIVRWIVITITAITVLGAGAWVLWRTPDLTSVPTVTAPADTAESALTLDADTEVAQAPGSRPAFAQAGADAAVSVPEESATVADETVADEVSESPQASLHIVAIAGTDGTVVWTGADGQLPQTVTVGERLIATARSADSLWLYVQTDEIEGWAEAAQLYAFNLDRLPVLDTTPNPDATVNTLPETTVFSAEYILEVDEVAETTIVERRLETEEMAVSAVVTLSSSRLNVRSGPNTDSAIIAKAYPDEEFTAIAQDESGEWLQIALPDVEGGFGWVSTAYMALSESIDTLPVSAEVSNAPTFGSAPAAADATTEASVLVSTDANSVSTSVIGAGATDLSGTLAFQTTHGTIYAYDLETDELWPLTAGFDPAISPDGTTVAFTRDGGENGLYLIDIDGSNERLIFSGRAGLASPKWSPDGEWIVFTRGDEYDECYVMGRGICLSPDEFAEQFPNGSPGDSPLVKEYEYNLAAVDINGENYHDIAALESAQAADWNEAGIVYQSSAGIQITTDTADAGNRLVTFDYLNPYYYDPDWQLDGGQIAFMQREASHWEIYVVNPDGSGLTALTKPVTTLVDEIPSNVASAYSPDGQYIVYLSNRGADNSAGAWQIWVMEADGSNARPLSVDVEIEYTFGDEQAVSWGV